MIGMYRTEAPEKCVRALLERHRRVWVNQNFETKGKIRLQRAYLNDLPVYMESRLPLEIWQRYGGVVLQNARIVEVPPVPALLLLECPLSERKLGMLALPAREVLVVRTPITWRLHEMILAQWHPGALACQEFHQWLLEQSQRMGDDEAAIAQALGHDVADIVAIGADTYAKHRFFGRAMEIQPDTSPAHCWPVKVITEPYPHAPFWSTWQIIRDRAPEVRGWKLITDKIFDDATDIRWQTHLALMRRMGIVHAAPQLSFLSIRKTPQFALAEAKLQAALDQLQAVTKLVAGWPMYPIDGVHGPIKPRRTRSAKRRAALKDAGLLPDSAG